LGVVLGGRIGYVLFYNVPAFVDDPLMLFRVWQGGMSFHGGLLGVLLVAWLVGRKYGVGFWRITDFVAPMIPIGLGAGRIGNFLNGELWGRVADLPWAMVFPGAGPDPRHPSQLYQALLEGLVMFVILWVFSSRPRPLRAVSGLFLILYGLFRFAVEFVREPDAHLGFIAFGWLTMGQLLTLPMILFGLWLMVWAYRHHPQPAGGRAP
jgi:phosphatidylglycerol:prolipoprotein diacylglycerol transferase